MDVVLLGDSRGYVPSGFNPGEEASTIGFRESFKNGYSDHIIQVINGRNEGWIKPSNIQMNIAGQKGVDSNYLKIRRSVHVAFASFMDNVCLHMNDDERTKLPIETYPFVNKIISYQLQHLTDFDELLAKTIAEVYVESPNGERFIQDPIHTNPITKPFSI